MALFDLLTRWQVLIPTILAIGGYQVNLATEERRHFEVNKQAIQEAETRSDTLLTRPTYVLTLLENAYPQHAYCAALSAMKSCVSALSDPNRAVGAAGLAECHGVTAADGHLDGLQDHLKRASEAVDREINLIAGRVGLSIWDLQDTADAAAERMAADPRGTTESCDSTVKIGAGHVFARWQMDAECLETLGLFQKTACLSRLGDLQAASLQRSLAEAVETAPVELALRPTCAEPPVIYIQIGSPDLRSLVRDLSAQLGAQGWPVAGIEAVPGYRAAGDIRYYYADQIACAEALAYDIARLAQESALGPMPTDWHQLKVIDLSTSYANLPKGRMELWLGQGS